MSDQQHEEPQNPEHEAATEVEGEARRPGIVKRAWRRMKDDPEVILKAAAAAVGIGLVAVAAARAQEAHNDLQSVPQKRPRVPSRPKPRQIEATSPTGPARAAPEAAPRVEPPAPPAPRTYVPPVPRPTGLTPRDTVPVWNNVIRNTMNPRY